MSKEDLNFNINEDEMLLAVGKFERKLAKIYLGGGKVKIEKMHAKGKMTARERIENLIDKDQEILEIGAFAGDKMYEEFGGCPSGGVVVVLAYVSGKQCIIVANDATVKLHGGGIRPAEPVSGQLQ